MKDFDIKHGNNSKKMLGMLPIICIVAIITFVVSKHRTSTPPERMSIYASYYGRPVMHTFYEKVTEGEDDLLEVWKLEWSNAGFDYRVLTLEDAKKHPYYEEMETIVTPLFGNGYDSMCFYRWLAMAASGGGWMSDYDTFPTNFPKVEGFNLPNEGQFTSFEDHIPCLLSGSADEWTRVSRLLMDAVPRVEIEPKSDMHTFGLIRGDENHGVDYRERTANLKEGFVYLAARTVDCEAMAVGRAIHIAHRYTIHAFQKGLFPFQDEVSTVDQAFGRRAEAIKVFLNDWRQQCGGSNIN